MDVCILVGLGLVLGGFFEAVFFLIAVVSCVLENLSRNPFGWAGVGGK